MAAATPQANVSEKKFFRDPIHGPIILQPNVREQILDVIDTPWIQRLRRISHLGASFYTFHGAEHSRFGHAMGALSIMSRLLRRLRDDKNHIAPSFELDAILAALLHDVGHGPFSHLFEEITGKAYDHEEVGKSIILNSSLKDVLPRPRRVVEFLDGRAPANYRFISELLSGPIDVDKMDYLLRDSHYAGVEYGQYDFDRLFHNIGVYEFEGKRRIGIWGKGKGVLEGFILARDQMFWSVYFHKTTRAVERLLAATFLRARDLSEAGEPVHLEEPIRNVVEGERLNHDDILDLDDHTVYEHLKRWRRSDDDFLSDLSRRLFDRDLFKMLDVTTQQVRLYERSEELEDAFHELGQPREYYLQVDEPSNVAYSSPYFPPGGTPATVIEVDGEEVSLLEISEVSDLIRAIKDKERKEVRVYSTRQGRERVREILGI